MLGQNSCPVLPFFIGCIMRSVRDTNYEIEQSPQHPIALNIFFARENLNNSDNNFM